MTQPDTLKVYEPAKKYDSLLIYFIAQYRLAGRPSLVGVADRDAIMNFPVESNVRLNSVYFSILSLPRHPQQRAVQCQKHLKSCLLRTIQVRHHSFCSGLRWYGRQGTAGSLTLGFFCNTHIVFTLVIASSVGHLICFSNSFVSF